MSSFPLPTPSDISLIITDVDGTLLSSSHTIHHRTLSAFRALRKKNPNIPIVIASGKQYESCRWIREELGLDDPLLPEENGIKGREERFPAIHCNGSLIYAGGSLSSLSSSNNSLPPPPIITKHLISPSTVLYLIAQTKSYGTFLFTHTESILVNKGEGVNRKDWYTIAGQYDANVLDRTKDENERRRVMESVEKGELEIVKVTICVDESDLEGASKHLSTLASSSISSSITLTRAIPFIFEYIPSTSSKSLAITQLSSYLSIPLDRILAFGDGENDTSLLEIVGWGVVMGNGMKSVKSELGLLEGVGLEGEKRIKGVVGNGGKGGKYLTGTNDEGGVGMFLEAVWGLDL